MSDQTFNNLTVLNSLTLPEKDGNGLTTKNHQLVLDGQNQSSVVYANDTNRTVVTVSDTAVNVDLNGGGYTFTKEAADLGSAGVIASGESFLGSVYISGSARADDFACERIDGFILRPDQTGITKVGPLRDLTLSNDMFANGNTARGFKTIGADTVSTNSLAMTPGHAVRNIISRQCNNGTLEGAKKKFSVPWTAGGFKTADYWDPAYPTRFTNNTTSTKRWTLSYNLVVKPNAQLLVETYLMSFIAMNSNPFVEAFDSCWAKSNNLLSFSLKGTATMEVPPGRYVEVIIAVNDTTSNFALWDRMGSTLMYSSVCLDEVQKDVY